MPTPGNITTKCRRCLENIAVAGPSTADELDLLDPSAPKHRQTLKAAQQSGYVVMESQLHHHDPARYSLTAKARARLASTGASSTGAVRTPGPTATRAKRYASPTAVDNVTPSISYGAMTTKRMSGPCADMLAPATRSGAEQALQIPSRVNDVLHYRDGRQVDMVAVQP